MIVMHRRKLKGTVLFIKKSAGTNRQRPPAIGAAATDIPVPSMRFLLRQCVCCILVPDAPGARCGRPPSFQLPGDPAGAGMVKAVRHRHSDNDGWYPDELIGCEVLQVNDHAEALRQTMTVDAHAVGKDRRRQPQWSADS